MRPFHPLFILKVIPELLSYLPVTLGMVAGTVFFGGICGFILAFAKVRRRPVTKALASAYTYVTRCVPSVVMLFVVYYRLPELLLSVGININGLSNGFFVIKRRELLSSCTVLTAIMIIRFSREVIGWNPAAFFDNGLNKCVSPADNINGTINSCGNGFPQTTTREGQL